MKGQREFFNGSFQLSGPSSSLSSREKVLKAEIIEVLDMVDKNQSFSSCNGDGERYRQMFPDSIIAKQFNQQETKAKYTLQFGIAPYVKEKVISDVSNKPFSFKFDETTTSQTKKQYDAYVTYFSYTSQSIITVFCGSLFVGHCTAAIMFLICLISLNLSIDVDLKHFFCYRLVWMAQQLTSLFQIN